MDVVRRFSNMFCVKALAVNSNVDLLLEQIKEFEPEKVVVFDENVDVSKLSDNFPNIVVLRGMT